MILSLSKARFSAILLWVTVFTMTGRAVSVCDFGAKGDGAANDTEAFHAALASGKSPIEVPSGIYRIETTEPIVLPKGTLLRGNGYGSCLVPTSGTKSLFVLSDHSGIEGIRFDGKNIAKGSYNDVGVIMVNKATETAIRNVVFENTDRVCVMTRNANNFVLRHSTFEKVGMALHAQYSHGVFFQDNRVIDARLHGVEIWGAFRTRKDGIWAWERRACSDIIATGNYFLNAGGEFGTKRGGSPLWGTGVVRAVFSNNIVDGAEDVGIDLEWSKDSVISGNTVRNCKAAGISLFFSCENVSITGNTVINDRPVTESEAGEKWWVRSGIWLTYLNHKEFPAEEGHRNISIVGNTITCADGPGRRAIWIGAGSKNVTLSANAISGGKILGGGETGIIPVQLQELTDNTHIEAVNPEQALK
jgi:parallel beta-helix repeat protein